jgi:hypothetical protein
MSTRHLPDPPDFEVDPAAARHEERRRRALRALDVGDVLAQVDDRLARAPAPTQHPCVPLVNGLLDRQLAVHGGAFWDAWPQVALQAIDRLVEARLQGED